MGGLAFGPATYTVPVERHRRQLQAGLTNSYTTARSPSCCNAGGARRAVVLFVIFSRSAEFV